MEQTDSLQLTEALELPLNSLDCMYSPDGRYLAVGHYNSPYLNIIDTSNWTKVSGTPSLLSSGRGCAFSPDGKHLAVAHNGSPYLTIIDTSNWTTVSGTPSLPNYGYSCTYSPDGSYLACCSNKLNIYNITKNVSEVTMSEQVNEKQFNMITADKFAINVHKDNAKNGDFDMYKYCKIRKNQSAPFEVFGIIIDDNIYTEEMLVSKTIAVSNIEYLVPNKPVLLKIDKSSYTRIIDNGISLTINHTSNDNNHIVVRLTMISEIMSYIKDMEEERLQELYSEVVKLFKKKCFPILVPYNQFKQVITDHFKNK
jgi:hypothetical protein